MVCDVGAGKRPPRFDPMNVRTSVSPHVDGGVPEMCTCVDVVAPTPYSPTAAAQYVEPPIASPNPSNVDRPESLSHVIVTMTGAVRIGPPFFESCPIHGVNAGYV